MMLAVFDSIKGALNTKSLNHVYAYVNGNPIRYSDPLGLYRGCHLVDGGAGLTDYWVCNEDDFEFNNGDASAFPNSTDNDCVNKCIEKEIKECITLPARPTLADAMTAAGAATICSIVTVIDCSSKAADCDCDN